jgi:hypothetical protein
MAIVATLQQTSGKPLNAYQYLITRYIIDVGLIQIVVSLLGIGLLSFYGDEAASWRIMAWVIIVSIGFYLPYYIRKRRIINAPWSVTPTAMTLGAVVAYCNIALSLLDVTAISVTASVVIFLIWAFLSMVTIFLVFLGSFMVLEDS